MKSVFVCFFFISVAYSAQLTQVNVTESERENIETVSIDVQRVQVDRDANGAFEDARILKVFFFI